MSGSSRSVTRALTPEELKERGYIPDIPTDIEVKEPTGQVAPVPPDLMSEPVGDQYTTSPTPLPEESVQPQVTPQVAPNLGKDWQPEIDAARKQGDEMRVYANIARVGEDINRAFVPRQQTNSYAKDIEEQAGLPEKRVREDIALSQTQAKTLAPKPDDDPFSASNISFRGALAASPEFAPFVKQLKDRGVYDGLTEGKLKTLLGVRQNQTKMTEGFEAADGKLRIADKTLQNNIADDKNDNDFARAQLDAQMRHNQVMEQIALINATRQSQSHGINEETGRSAIDDRAFAKNLQALGKATTQFAEIKSALGNIDSLVPGLTDGKLPKNFPVTMAEKAKAVAFGGVAAGTIKQQDEALVKAQRDFAKIVAAYRSGLTVSEQERAYYDTMFGNKVWSDPVTFANAVKLFKGYVYERLKTTQQAFAKTGNPTIDKFQPLEDWENIEGSISYRDPFWKGVGGPGTRGAIVSPPVSAPVQTPAPAPAPTKAPPIVPASTNPPASTPVTSPAQSTPPATVTVTNKKTGKSKVMPADKAEMFRADPANFEVK